PDFESAIKQKRLKKAMAISLKGLQLEVGKMPLWCIILLITLISAAESKKEEGTRMLDLLHTLPADVEMARALDSTFERYKDINIPVYLLAGSKSPSYFHTGLNALEKILPQSRTNIFPGFDHYSPEEKVQEISAALKQFFEE